MTPEWMFWLTEASLFVSGLFVGKWAEASKWRTKAESGQLRESDGKLYHVTRHR
jgi:hypothetical protein